MLVGSAKVDKKGCRRPFRGTLSVSMYRKYTVLFNIEEGNMAKSVVDASELCTRYKLSLSILRLWEGVIST